MSNQIEFKSCYINCLHVVASLHPCAGGPSRTVVQLADFLADISGVDVAIMSQGLKDDLTVHSQSEYIDRHVYESSSRFSLRFGFPVRKELKHIMLHQTPTLLHSHGLWLPVNYWAARAARRYSVPLVIHPRGMLEPWALSHKAWKKRLAMSLFQRRDLESAALLIATSLDEYQNIRNLGFTQPVAVIPNGIQLDTVDKSAPLPAGRRTARTALFLSRIHPKKGLLNLMTAWGQLRPANWRLRIAGPDEGGHLAEVMAAARAHGVEDVVDYVGEVDGERKAAIYRDADLFVLPTFSENFGVVVAEALTHGLPVITTRGAPWADLETYGCGWWIDTGVDPLINALRDAIALSDEDRAAMGVRGRVYVQRYDWNDIARQTVAAYCWVLGEGPLPDCVRVD